MLSEKTLFLFTLLLLLYLPFRKNAQQNDTGKIYYISIGDSFAEGLKITGPLPGNRTFPAYSYADALHYLLSKKYKNLELLKYGRGGHTSDDLINKQLNKTIDFVKSNSGLTKLITITIGTNDVSKCNSTNNTCYYNKLDNLKNNLNNIIIPKLKEAGGEGVKYAASTYFWYPSLEDTLVDIYNKNEFKVADLRSIINFSNNTICNYTYWCEYHDVHPNTDGVNAIGGLFYKVLGESLLV
ncbi:hypothetical protein C2G38_2247633 [Gigaspora rosea]|uniref:Uncharacterized protein n=1 Tax=Gigaspora rosea TaxID=44941 RepID=A0A397UYX5_9GLOM|nr:hypothetical protein C2G38_2247633 [Gigaspora rosea]